MPRAKPALMQIGNRIVECREERGITATQLAIMADMPSATLSRIESGQQNPGVMTLCRIAKALKVPLSALQPTELDEFSNVPQDIFQIMNMLNELPPEQARMMTVMFKAQLQSLV